MCIIAIYQNGKRPDRATVSRMMTTNPHGVGIAWNNGKRVCFRKGFEKVESVMRFFDTLKNANDIVFHARIATSGGISAEKCHPFPVAVTHTYLNKTAYCDSAPVCFHNGVFSIDIEKGLNDTQTFIKNCIVPLAKVDPKGLYNSAYDDLIEMSVRGSRFVIMYPDRLLLYGTWTEDNGVLYSNTGYKPSKWFDDYEEETWYKRWRETHPYHKGGA